MLDMVDTNLLNNTLSNHVASTCCVNYEAIKGFKTASGKIKFTVHQTVRGNER